MLLVVLYRPLDAVLSDWSTLSTMLPMELQILFWEVTDEIGDDTHLATERSMQLFLYKICSIAYVCKVFKLDKQLIRIGYTNIIALA